MQRNEHHLCLVSNQPVPSLTPLIDSAFGCKQVILAYAPERKREAESLAQALVMHGVEGKLEALHDGYNLGACRAGFAALASRYPNGLTVNITGGSKIMTIAAWEVFNRPQDRLYYIDIRQDSITWLRPSAPPTPVANRVNIATYFASLGVCIRKEPIPSAPLIATESAAIARNLTYLKQLGKRKSVTNGLLGGYWLERYIHHEIAALARIDPLIHDYGSGLHIVHSEGGDDTPNELDVFCLRDNTAYLFECKSGKVGNGPDAIDAIYKLAQISQRLVGMRGRGIFVSTEVLSPGPLKRARQFGIQIIDRHQLPYVGQHIRDIFLMPVKS